MGDLWYGEERCPGPDIACKLLLRFKDIPFPALPLQATVVPTEVTACTSCSNNLVTHCGKYNDGTNADLLGTSLGTDDVCPQGSTQEPHCVACAAGFYGVGARGRPSA